MFITKKTEGKKSRNTVPLKNEEPKFSADFAHPM
jgi:hypothetical protein